MADHNINFRSQQAFMVKEWIGIANFILERITAIIPKMSSFYLGGAQDSYRIISVHIEKLMQSLMAAQNSFQRPQDDTTTSVEVDKMLSELTDSLIPAVTKPKEPELPAKEFYYETKDNICYHTHHKLTPIENKETGETELVWVDEPTEVYQSDKKDEWLHDRLMDHYRTYGPKSNPASIGRCSRDTVGPKHASQPDYYLDPHDLAGFYTMTNNENFRPVGGTVDHEIGDDYEGLYMFFDGILDPSFVGTTRWYAIPTCFNQWTTQRTTNTYRNWSVKDNKGGWYTLRKPVITNSTFWCPGQTLGDNQMGDHNWGLRPGWIYSYGYKYGDSNIPGRHNCFYTRFNFNIALDKVDPAIFKNVDQGMLLHESPVDPDVYVFGYSYYKSMVRTLIYNLKGLSVSVNWLGGQSDLGQANLGKDNGLQENYAYFDSNNYYNKTFNPINVTTNQWRFLSPGKWMSGTDTWEWFIPVVSGITRGDMGYGYSGNAAGSPNFEHYDGYDDMDSHFMTIKTNVDIWKTFKGQCELNRYYYPLWQIYDKVDASYQNRFLKVFGSADYNMVDLYKYKSTAYDHGPYQITLQLDGKSIIPLYIEVVSTEVDAEGATKDKQVNIHFTGGQETWFSPYFNWTASVALLIKQVLELFLDKMNTEGTTDMDVFNMYQKANEYITFFKTYSDTIVNILSVPPLGGEGMSPGIGTLGSGSNPGPSPMAKRKYKIKNKKGKTLHEFFAPNVTNS